MLGDERERLSDYSRHGVDALSIGDVGADAAALGDADVTANTFADSSPDQRRRVHSLGRVRQ